MFAAVCRFQWKTSFTVVALLAVAAFVVPLLAVRPAGFSAPDRFAWDTVNALAAVEAASGLFPILAVIVGLVLAISAWSADHQAEHVYALTLPVPRWYYVLLRFGAGAVLIVPVVLAVGLGCAVALASIELPAGLRTYGVAVTLRFALTALVCYAALFALAAGTKRTAALTFATVIGLFVVAELLELAGVAEDLSVVVADALFAGPGPFAVALGPWMLIGV